MPRPLGTRLIPAVRRIGAYLINDTFTVDRAAGSVDGTAAEPGPGRRLVVDTDGKLSLSGGTAIIASASPASSNPLLNYAPQSRVAGRLAKFAATSASGNAPLRAGFIESGGSGVQHTITFLSSFSVASTNAGVNDSSWGSRTPTVENDYAVLLRSAGAMYFQKSTNWLLGWISASGSSSPVQPGISSIANGASASISYFRVPSASWLPTPLISDGFGSALGSSDGLGHPEGVAGGLGSGGGGLAWTQHVGVWSASGGVATSTLVAGRALASVDCGAADVIISVTLAVGADSAALSARYVDESNRIELRHTGTAVQLVKVIAGVSTTMINSANTFVAGATLRLSCIGTKFRAYYNNVLIGAEQTIADAAVASATRVGLRNANVTNTFDNFTVYAIGSSGEYAILDTF